MYQATLVTPGHFIVTIPGFTAGHFTVSARQIIITANT